MLKSNSQIQERLDVIDVEATGLGSGSVPIEVGVVLGSGERYEALIRPLSHWTHWDHTAEALHGICHEELMINGKTAKTVCDELNQLCEGRVLFSDCWVYDSSWLFRLFAEVGVKMMFQCRAMEVILTERQILHWVEYKQQSRASLGLRPHRALNDAEIISDALNGLAQPYCRRFVA